jgi:hypothetical protein
MTERFCPYCGKKIPKSAKVCPYCGEEQSNAEVFPDIQISAKPKLVKQVKVERRDENEGQPKVAAESFPPKKRKPIVNVSAIWDGLSGYRSWIVIGAFMVASIINEIFSNRVFEQLNTDNLSIYFGINGAIYGIIIWAFLRVSRINVSPKQGAYFVLAWGTAWALRPVIAGMLDIDMGPNFGWTFLRVFAAMAAGFVSGVIIQRGPQHFSRNVAVISALGWGSGWLMGSLVASIIPESANFFWSGNSTFMGLGLNWFLGILLAVSIGGYAHIWLINEN